MKTSPTHHEVARKLYGGFPERRRARFAVLECGPETGMAPITEVCTDGACAITNGDSPSMLVLPDFVAVLSHEAHHRGQVCMLAHQLGFPLSTETTSGIWNWEKLWKGCGSPRGPGYWH